MAVDNPEYSWFQVRDTEMLGEKLYKGCFSRLINDDRKILGKTIPTDEAVWHNRSSIVCSLLEKDPVLENVYSKLPKALFPRDGDTPAVLRRRLAKCRRMDLLFNHFANKTPVSLNEWENCKQPSRRTAGVVKRGARIVTEEDGIEKAVISLFGYNNTECPVNLWSCNPMCKYEYAQLLRIWEVCWSSLTGKSRESPPNGYQLLAYYPTLDQGMNQHRDNYDSPTIIRNVVNGKEVPWGENPTVRGAPNCQVRGSSVIIYSRGRPMTMTFKYATLDKEVTQSTRDYVTSPSFQMMMGDGYITVFDPIDDLLCTHEIHWSTDVDDGDATPRFAWVYRWLEVSNDYYANCRIRRTKEMMSMKAREIDESNPLYERNIFWRIDEEHVDLDEEEEGVMEG